MGHGEYSDGKLLAFLDGELPPAEMQDVGRHLDSCWDCRTRLAELEEDVHEAARAFRDGSWYSSASLERSRRRLHAAMNVEQVRRRPLGRYLAPLAAASLAFAGGVVWYVAHPKPNPAPLVREVVRSRLAPVPQFAPSVPRLAPAAPAQPQVLMIPALLEPDLTGALLDVYEALHRTGACTQEQPSVGIAGRAVRIKLIAPTRERRDTIAAELLSLSNPALELELASMEDDAGPQHEVVFVPGMEIASPATGRRLTIHDDLVRRLRRDSEPTEREIRDLADSVLRSSELLNVQHRALAALAEAFPETVEAALPAPARERLQRLVHSHQQQLRAAERNLRSSLQPVAGNPVLLAGSEPSSWRAGARASAVPELHRLLTRLFALSVHPESAGAGGLDEVSAMLAHPLLSGDADLAAK